MWIQALCASHKNNKHLTVNHTRIISISKRKICVDEDEEVRSERNSILEYMDFQNFEFKEKRADNSKQ